MAPPSNDKLVIDSNLLVLWVVGLIDPEMISRHRRTRSFDQSDFTLLTRLLKPYRYLVTTPNILTEVSNLIAQIDHVSVRKCWSELSTRISELDEQYLPSAEVTQHTAYVELGLTDACISRLAENGYVVLSTDFALTQRLTSRGPRAINFNHYRKIS